MTKKGAANEARALGMKRRDIARVLRLSRARGVPWARNAGPGARSG